MQDILPGNEKRYIHIGSQFPNDILEILNQQPLGEVDTVVLGNGDVWRYFDDTELIFNHPKLQDKNVFLQTLGYTNTKFNRYWEISYPLFYWQIKKSTDPFVAKPIDLKYGFSCLNNTNNIHRTLLGYNLYKNNLLNDIIFSQNIAGSEYALTRVSQESEALNLLNFEDYKNLLPIRYNEPLDPQLNFADDHSINHDAYTKAYCNIVTESECEEYPYERNINLPVITEKSYKPFRSGQIPVMLAAQGHLAYLKSLGFEMMEDLLPAGYDNMNVLQKIDSIVTLVSAGKDFIKDFYFNHLKEIQHNYELVNSNRVEELILQRIKDTL